MNSLWGFINFSVTKTFLSNLKIQTKGKKNWKTTITGLIGAISVALIPVISGQGFQSEAIITATVLAILGVLARDFDNGKPTY